MQNVEQLEMFLYVAGTTLGLVGVGFCIYRLINRCKYGGHHAEELPLNRGGVKGNTSNANNYNLIGYV